MSAPAITIDVLPAGYGDCLFVTCPGRRGTWRMLMDTGPTETMAALKPRLMAIRPGRDGRRRIDVLAITHIDHDHIGGAGLLLADRDLKLSVGDVWFNAPVLAGTRGVDEARSLAELLGSAGADAPWNLAFGGGLAQLPADGKPFVLSQPPGAPTLTLLSPTRERLAALFRVWEHELELAHRGEDEPAGIRGVAAPEPPPADLAALAAKKTPTDASVPNGASLAMLLEHRGASVLLAGDAVPTVLQPALGALATARGRARLHVDAIKVAHHGSRANTTRALLDRIQADHYVISTNNRIFGHPDDEALARIVVFGGPRPTLWFNHATDHNRRWADAALQARNGFRTVFPPAGGAGVTLTLPAR